MRFPFLRGVKPGRMIKTIWEGQWGNHPAPSPGWGSKGRDAPTMEIPKSSRCWGHTGCQHIGMQS